MFKAWNGFTVPERDSDKVLGRRLVQLDEAFYEVGHLALEKRVMVQAGGNWGYWPHRFAYMFDTVYTFEPDSVCFTCLALNTRLQRNVVRLQAALGYRRDLVELWRDFDTTGNQRIEGDGIYPTLRIDDLNLGVCDLIYLDVEGREFEALLGANGTIKRCSPTVIFESRRAFKEQMDAANDLMKSHGYKWIREIGKDQVFVPMKNGKDL